MPEREVPAHHLQDQVVDHVEQVGDGGRGGVGDQWAGQRLALHRAHNGGGHGMRGPEVRISRGQRPVLVEHLLEPPEVGARNVGRGPLPLLDDHLQHGQCRLQVVHRLQVRPAERISRRLRPGRSDEQPVLPQLLGKVAQCVTQRPVQLPLGQERLRTRLQLTGGHRRWLLAVMDERDAVRNIHAHRPLEVHEMRQRLLAEGQQRELHRRRVALGTVWEVGPRDEGRRTDRGQQVVDHRPVHHLLSGDLQQRALPPADRFQLLGGQPRAGSCAQTECRVEVLGHCQVLDLGGLAQQVGQFLAMVNDDRGRRHHPRMGPVMVTWNGPSAVFPSNSQVETLAGAGPGRV